MKHKKGYQLKYIIAVDLGTTLIKFCLYDENLKYLYCCDSKYNLEIRADLIEFDVQEYWEIFKKGLVKLIQKVNLDVKDVVSISLSSQAETLVVLDKYGKPLRKAISWLDERSYKECNEIKNNFDINKCYSITGQPDIIPTWPATKILWIKNNEENIFKSAYKYLLLKDYIIYKLTGSFKSEFTIYNFSYYFDIIKKRYWTEILDYIGVQEDQLPELFEPGVVIEDFSNEFIKEFGFSAEISLNIGCLDQMAGMIGSGNIRKGMVSETTGTVLAICTVLDKPLFNKFKIPCHYNSVKDTYSLLAVCESGGICLEWFRRNFLGETNNYDYINYQIEKVSPGCKGLIFLPYLVGVNAPEFNKDTRGCFFGIKLSHDKRFFMRSIMEGIAYMLKKNLDILENMGIKSDNLLSLGGGSKSYIWNKIKADITGKNIIVNKNEEVTSLGVAILSAVKLGFFKNIDEAISNTIRQKDVIPAGSIKEYEVGYLNFLDIYNKLYK